MRCTAACVQAPGCVEDVSNAKAYFKRHLICRCMAQAGRCPDLCGRAGSLTAMADCPLRNSGTGRAPPPPPAAPPLTRTAPAPQPVPARSRCRLSEHMRAPALFINGTTMRFCQQCGRWVAAVLAVSASHLQPHARNAPRAPYHLHGCWRRCWVWVMFVFVAERARLGGGGGCEATRTASRPSGRRDGPPYLSALVSGLCTLARPAAL